MTGMAGVSEDDSDSSAEGSESPSVVGTHPQRRRACASRSRSIAGRVGVARAIVGRSSLAGRAVLSGATLSGSAVLTGAILSGTTRLGRALPERFVSGTTLSGAALPGVVFSGTTLFGTTFSVTAGRGAAVPGTTVGAGATLSGTATRTGATGVGGATALCGGTGRGGLGIRLGDTMLSGRDAPSFTFAGASGRAESRATFAEDTRSGRFGRIGAGAGEIRDGRSTETSALDWSAAPRFSTSGLAGLADRAIAGSGRAGAGLAADAVLDSRARVARITLTARTTTRAITRLRSFFANRRSNGRPRTVAVERGSLDVRSEVGRCAYYRRRGVPTLGHDPGGVN